MSDEVAVLSPSLRRMAVGGIVGVGGFVGAWAICGATRSGYSPVNDAISRLAETGTTNRHWMTAGFVALGIGVPIYSLALRRAVAGPAWIAAFATGVATLGVAALPLGAADAGHGIAATAGYATLAATPLLASRTFRANGHDTWANVSVACGVGTALALTASIAEPFHGASQRLGLVITDAWIVATAWRMWRTGRLP